MEHDTDPGGLCPAAGVLPADLGVLPSDPDVLRSAPGVLRLDASARQPGPNDLHVGPYALHAVRPGLPVMTLAPMAGVGNWVFRLLCARLGARLVGVEFVNARNIGLNALHVHRALDYADLEEYSRTGLALLAPQIYGNDPELIAAGAQRFVELGAPVVDINFGCSVPRILAKGSGAAYLRDLDRLYRAVQLAVRAVPVPVIVKTRLGWDADSINVLDVVRRVQDAGAAAIALHARTVQQRYSGVADWTWIARACAVASIPVIGNGDVRRPADAVRMQQQTGCRAVMIGRAALANPWIFAGRDGACLRERIDLALVQLHLMARWKGERTGVLETRKHLARYFGQLPRHAPLRRRILTTESLPELTGLLRRWQRQLTDPPIDPDLGLTAAAAAQMACGST